MSHLSTALPPVFSDFRCPTEKTTAQWTSSLHFAAKWGFESVQLLAIDNFTTTTTIIPSRSYAVIPRAASPCISLGAPFPSIPRLLEAFAPSLVHELLRRGMMCAIHHRQAVSARTRRCALVAAHSRLSSAVGVGGGESVTRAAHIRVLAVPAAPGAIGCTLRFPGPVYLVAGRSRRAQ